MASDQQWQSVQTSKRSAGWVKFIPVVSLCLVTMFAWLLLQDQSRSNTEIAAAKTEAIALSTTRTIDQQFAALAASIRSITHAASAREILSLSSSDLRNAHGKLSASFPGIQCVAVMNSSGDVITSYPQGEFTSLVPRSSRATTTSLGSTASLGLPSTKLGNEQAVFTVQFQDGGEAPACFCVVHSLKSMRETIPSTKIAGGGNLLAIDSERRIVISEPASRMKPFDKEVVPQAIADMLKNRSDITLNDANLKTPVRCTVMQAKTVKWTVLVAQPASGSSLAATMLTTRFLVIFLPVVLVIGIGTMALTRFAGSEVRSRQQLAEVSRRLADRNEELNKLGNAKSDFLLNVSHDLRTPLAIIQASVAGLIAPDVRWSRHDMHHSLVMVDQEIHRLASRVRNLLDMARIEFGEFQPHQVTCDLLDIVGGAFERVSGLVNTRTVKAEYPDEALLIWRPEQMSQD
jgi:hypothetical protein